MEIDDDTLPNGTLKNKLGLTDKDELKDIEIDLVYFKLMSIQKQQDKLCDENLLKRINKYLFGDVYDWAGEYRKYPVEKKEYILYGESINYASPEDISHELNTVIKDMNDYDWKDRSIDEITEKFTSSLTKIWKTHPFREGNTRTVLAFAEIFAREHGFEMDMSKLMNNLGRKRDPRTGDIIRYSLRDRFVLASLEDDDKPDAEPLKRIFKKSIVSGIEKKIEELDDLLDR